MVKLIYKFLIVFVLGSSLIISACKVDGETSQKVSPTSQKNNTVKKQNKRTQRTPSPYWAAARKDIPLNEVQENHVRAIQNKYKKEINQLKKQKKWDADERTRIERERAKEIKNKLGSELYDKYNAFNKNWANKKVAPKQPGPYWGEVKKSIPLTDKEISKIKSIQNKYKKEINQLKKQKKWDADERTRIERARAKEIEKLLGEKYDKYEKFNADWLKKKK